MYCFKCGKPLYEGAHFCSFCGSQVATYPSYSINRGTTGTIQLRCNSCGGTLFGNANSPILNCPFCHSNEMIIESDAVKTQRLKSNENITIALDKTNTARKMANDARNFEREKRNTLSIKGKIILATAIISLILCIILFILAEVFHKSDYILIIAIIAFGWECFGITQLFKD